MKKLLLAAATVFLATTIWAKPAATISGTYLEVRSCDVYTGPCFSNAEMGTNGKEAILTWSIQKGMWNNIDLAGLNVVRGVGEVDQGLIHGDASDDGMTLPAEKNLGTIPASQGDGIAVSGREQAHPGVALQHALPSVAHGDAGG